MEKRSFRQKRIRRVPRAAGRCLSVYAVAVIALLWAFASLAGAEETASLRTLTLEESLKLAEAQHPQVIAAREERRAAEGGVVEARSGFYPHLQASAGLFHLEEPPALALGPLTARMGRENMGFINVGATQTLYAGGRIRDGFAIAALSGEAAEERLRAVRDEIALQTKRAFYGLLFTRELVQVRREALALLEEHLATTRKKYREGAVSEFDVLRAEVEVANARPPLIEAENRSALGEANLKRIVGLDLKTPISVIGELKERSFPDVDEAETREKAQECRAEVRAAGRVAQIAAAQEEIARAGNRPTVSLFANYFGTSPEFFLAQERDLRWNWIAGVNLSFTLFSGFETRGRIAKARGERGAARARLQDIEDQVGLEVREALLRLSEADALMRSQRENVRQAERALKIARLRYEQGAATQLEVTDSRVALTQAQVNRLSALYRYEIALAELERAAGCPPGGRKE